MGIESQNTIKIVNGKGIHLMEFSGEILYTLNVGKLIYESV